MADGGTGQRGALRAGATWHEPRAALSGRLESFLLARIDPARAGFTARAGVPRLTWNRFDLAVKLAYLDSRAGLRSAFAKALYAAHIHAFSLGAMAEPGAAEKTGIDRFTGDFEALLAALAAGGFDPAQSLIPLAADGSLLNGGHRAACAIHLQQPVAMVETGLPPFVFDYRYFRARGMADADLDAAAIHYAARAPGARLALLWPAAAGSLDRTERALGGIAYRKDLRLGPRGAHNLLAEVYAGEPWLGPAAADYPGLGAKLTPCFAGKRPLRAYLFDAADGDDPIALKQAIRDIHGIGKHSIHIADTHAETLALARIVFNRQSLHFLEHARPNRFAETAGQLRAFAALLAGQRIDPELAAVDTGLVLGAYGLRPAADVDFLCARDLRCAPPFERHGADRYGRALAELLQDPACHFHHRGLKFVALDLVAGLKRTRRAGRDREDLARIGPLLTARASLPWRSALVYKARFATARARHLAIRGLRAVGADGPARRLYRRLRR